jgi:hypothetical protein
LRCSLAGLRVGSADVRLHPTGMSWSFVRCSATAFGSHRGDAARPLGDDRRLADARLAPRERRAQRHRAFRRAHALQGDRSAQRRGSSPRRSTRSAASWTPSRPRSTPATTSRCSTSTCRSPWTCWPTSCCARRFAPDEIEREKKVILEEIKMVEDTPDDLVHELFTSTSGRGIRWAGRFSARARRSRRSARRLAARLLPRRLRGLQHDRGRGREPRARARPRAARAGVRRPVAGEGEAGEAQPRVVPRSSRGPRSSSRATSASAPQLSAGHPIATSATS